MSMQSQVVEVGAVRLGDGFAIIAGPCAVETREQMLATAHAVRERGAAMLRAGAFKPRTSPHSFQGLGWKGVELLAEAGRETGLPTVSEVMEPSQVERMCEQVDMVQIGARNMQNFALLRAVGKTRTPVLLKRGLSATIDELLSAADYILAEGNKNVALCERGIRTFEHATRNTLDLSAVPVLRERTSLPIIVDPSHAVGVRRWIRPLCRAAKAVGAHGILVEVHPDPEAALSDKEQALTFDDFSDVVADCERIPGENETPITMRGIRGAITVDADDRDAIGRATKQLLQHMIERNSIALCDITSVLFSLTSDIHAAFPAMAARELGWSHVPMLHFAEIDVPGALERTIRVLLHVNTRRRQHDIEHIYLEGARVLRPDLLERAS
jgi:monofunctional chorismate mutase